MLGRAAHAKKASKFEDSDSSHMSRPRGLFELPHRPAPRLPPRLTRPAAAPPVGWEANGARHRGLLAAGRGTPPPRSPLHEKKPAGSRAVELEAKLGKAHDQLAEMREQLAAAEKARKDARGAFAQAKKRAAAKKRDPVVDSVPAEVQQLGAAQFVADGVANGGHEEMSMRSRNSTATDVLEPTLSATENNIALVVADGDGEMKGTPEAEQLRAKVAAKDKEAYELRAKLMAKDMEIHDLRAEVAAKDADFDELMARLIAKDAETAALGAHNAHLMKEMAEEATKARGITDRALRESAAREARLAERLGASERAREALDAEARRVRVQGEQWRKAAEEAAAVLGAGASGIMGDRRVGKETRRRHGSAGSNGDGTEKRDAADDEGSGGVRKAGGSMRVLTDLWRKKVHK